MSGPVPVDVAILQHEDGTLVSILACHPEAAVLTIGRGREADIRLKDPYVSRAHLRIAWDAVHSTHILIDCGAVNGSYLNGRRLLRPTRILDGARIRLGDTTLLYVRQFA